ncbi:MAG: hypothetical protein ACE15D_10540 [Candidatus Eisenbacteria bacterium]
MPLRNRVRSLSIAAILCAVSTLGSITVAAPIGTEITYQGALQDGGSPANGSYDFRFRLFDAISGGNQVGSGVAVENLAVANGVFTAVIDFGQNGFGPDGRWLEVGVRPGADSDPAPYTILTPRQQVTASPVSLFSLGSGDNHWSQNGSAITNNNDGFVGINRSTRVTTSEYFGVQAATNGYGGMYMATDGAEGLPFYGYSTGARSAWTYLDGANGNWFVHNGADRVVVTSTGEVGIGTLSPDYRLEVTSGDGDAIHGSTTAAFSAGISGTGTTAGVSGICGTSNGSGVFGQNNSASGTGVRGETSGNSGAGVAGYAPSGTGVYGQTSTGYAIYGSNGGSNLSGYAGYFNGRVHVAGILSKASGSFKIDHPLDPLNKTLSHSFVESPDMMNIYNGNVTTDEKGLARVDLPGYFEALNRDFRYQLTVLGEFANATIAEEVKDNSFVIRTDKPSVRVSWQVTGIRHDAWAAAHPIVVEEEKSSAEQGHYINPGAYGTADLGSEMATPAADAVSAAGTAR